MSDGWRDLIIPKDQERLNGLAPTRAAALVDAEAAIAAKDYNALEAADAMREVMAAPPVAVAAEDIKGVYRCRVFKLGGDVLPLIGYPYFSCRIQQGPSGSLAIQKTSGSQRFIGRLWLDAPANSYVFLGASYVNDDQPWAYNQQPSENQVGRLYRIGDGRLRLELPKPYYESNLDVFDLVRVR